MNARLTRLLAGLAAPVCAAALLVGCSALEDEFNPPRLEGGCGIAVDGSGSGSSKTGFDAAGEARRNVDPFLKNAGCRYVAFAPIAGASEGHFCTQPRLDLDPDIAGSRRDVTRGTQRAKALTSALAVLDCIRKDPRSKQGSDVLGGLKALAKNRPAAGDTYRLLVISDFSHGTREGGWLAGKDLSTQAARNKVIAQYARQGRIPNLPGADVATAGFGKLFSDDSRKYAGFDAFWRDLMLGYAKCEAFHPVDAVS